MVTYVEAISERQSPEVTAARKVAQSTQFASLQFTHSVTQALVRSPLFALRFMTQATLCTLELLERQVLQAKALTDILVKPPSTATRIAPNALVATADDAAQTAATTTDDDKEAPGKTDAVASALLPTADEDQKIELREERIVISKQRVEHSGARVRKAIVTELKSIDVPVSHEELVIERHTVTGDGNVDGEPIADETIRIPLVEQKVDLENETAAREEVEIGEHRVDDVEPISADYDQAMSHERVQERAYALWEKEGRPEGRQFDDWAEAEREIYAIAASATAV